MLELILQNQVLYCIVSKPGKRLMYIIGNLPWNCKAQTLENVQNCKPIQYVFETCSEVTPTVP